GACLARCGAVYEMETRLRPLTDPLSIAAKTGVDELAYQLTSRLEHFRALHLCQLLSWQSHRHQPPTNVPTKMGTSVIASGLQQARSHANPANRASDSLKTSVCSWVSAALDAAEGGPEWKRTGEHLASHHHGL